VSPDAEVVLAVIRAIEERDAGTMLRLFHDEVELHEAASLPYGGATCGKARLGELLEREPERTWLGTWGPLQPTAAERRMDARVIGEDAGLITVTYTLRAVSPSGGRFEAPVVALYRVRDGRFAWARMFHQDTVAVLAFLDRAAGELSDPGRPLRR
jgi:ketosteroid isomerase-like protein